MPAKSNTSVSKRQSGGKRRTRRSKSGLAAILELASLTFWGRLILALLITAVVAAINLLASSNSFELFFMISGIELVVVAVIFWIRFMIRSR